MSSKSSHNCSHSLFLQQSVYPSSYCINANIFFCQLCFSKWLSHTVPLKSIGMATPQAVRSTYPEIWPFHVESELLLRLCWSWIVATGLETFHYSFKERLYWDYDHSLLFITNIRLFFIVNFSSWSIVRPVQCKSQVMAQCILSAMP